MKGLAAVLLSALAAAPFGVRSFQQTTLATRRPTFVAQTPTSRMVDGRRCAGVSVAAAAASDGTDDKGGAVSPAATPATTTPSTTTTTMTRLENSSVALDIVVPGTATQAAYDKVCMELSKTIQIAGFRKGARLPPAVLEQAMAAKSGGRNAIKVQAISELIGTWVEPALREQALDPIGQPRLTPLSAEDMAATTFVPGQPLTLSIQCDVWPEIVWSGPYTDLTGTYQRKPFDETKLQAALNDLKERYVVLEPIDNTNSNYQLQMGDACTVNMVGYMAADDAGTVKGELLPDAASGDKVEVVLGKGRYMEGLVEGLVGAKVGDTVVVTVTFPEVGWFQL